MTIKYPNYFFEHTQGNTLSDINITREDIIDSIKTISQNSSGGPDEFPTILQTMQQELRPLSPTAA